jgi:FlaA1/EpsC-like NDP-sugar epimerase
MEVFKGKHVLVTGAGGSIGSRLCERVMSDNARKLTLLSLTESGLYNVERSLRRQYTKYRDTELVPVLGSVCDEGLLAEILTGVDVVIHTAAHKHVPICELNPLAAIENNVGGTWNLMCAAAYRGVGSMCLVSTDKAVKPVSVMGRTKRVCELLMRDCAPPGSTKFFTVRFGNVLDSAGSVLPLWREQIAAGGPITITDYRCERYFMSIDDAVSLIAAAFWLNPWGGTFVLDMGKPRRLIDMAKELCRHAADQVEILCIGLRPGEKITEELHYGAPLSPTAAKGVFAVVEKVLAPLQRPAVAELLGVARRRDRQQALKLLKEMTE